jgi:chemotaxis signal transduction protein
MVTATAPRTTAAGLVKLSVGPFAVALPVDRVVAVERADRVRTAGGAAVVTPGGEFPVVPLAAALGGEWPIPPRTGQVALVEHAGRRYGLWVERVTSLPHTAAPRLVPAPAVGAGGPFAQIALLDDGPLPLLDFDRLVGDQPEVAPRPADPRPAPTRTAPANRLLVVGEFDHPAGRAVGFGLSAGCVDEITDVAGGTKVPGAPPHVLALVEWRGRAVPKVDPAAWCGLPRAADGARVAIVRTAANDRLAVAVGSGVTAVPLPIPHTAGRFPLPLNPERVLGTVELPGRTLILPRWDAPTSGR